MPTASVSDVRGVIDTSLDDSEITNFLNDAEYEAKQEIGDYDTAYSTTDKKQLEKYLASLLIRTTKEKGLSSQSGANRSMSYEGVMSVSELRKQVDKRDTSGNLAQGALTDTNRYTGST
jgi:hypothetical protein